MRLTTIISASFFLLILGSFSFGACGSPSSSSDYPEEDDIPLSREDDPWGWANEQLENAREFYDKKLYGNSHHTARGVYNGKEADENQALQALSIMAWSNLQRGLYDDYEVAQTSVVYYGAETLFKRMLEINKNEFLALQGIATLNFYRFRSEILWADLFRGFADICDETAATVDRLVVMERDKSIVRSKVDDLRDKTIIEWREMIDNIRRVHEQNPDVLTKSIDPSDPELGWKDWEDEDLTLDRVRKDLVDADSIDAGTQLVRLRKWAKARSTYWETSALSNVAKAEVGFLKLSRRAPNYQYIDQSLFQLHYEAGLFFLAKGMDLAKEFAEAQLNWSKIPDNERNEIIESYFADPESHPNPWRAPVKDQFKKAIKHLDQFLSKDKLSIEREEELFGALEGVFMTEQNQNVVAADYKRLFHQGTREIVDKRTSIRLNHLRMLVVLLTYDWSLNTDLQRALIRVQELESSDSRDPIPHFIRGIIYNKQKQYAYAADELNLFLRKSSIVADMNRRAYARDLLNKVNLKRLETDQETEAEKVAGAFDKESGGR